MLEQFYFLCSEFILMTMTANCLANLNNILNTEKKQTIEYNPMHSFSSGHLPVL